MIELNDKERAVLVDAANGLTATETSLKRFYSKSMIKRRRSDVCKKLNANTTAHAVALALVTGILKASEVNTYER